MGTATAEPTVLDGLIDRRAKVSADWDKLIEDREAARQEFEARTSDEDATKHPTDDERTAYAVAEEEHRTAIETIKAEWTALDERCNELEGKAKRQATAETHAEPARAKLGVDRDKMVYRKDNAHEVSYFKDMIATDRQLRAVSKLPNGESWNAAEERLAQHGKMMTEIVEVREAEATRAAETEIEAAELQFRGSLPKHLAGSFRGFEASPFEKRGLEQRANPSRGPGVGGEFVPPLWLVEDDFIPYLRAGRVIAPQLRNLPVPPGTDTIKLPKIKLGTEVAPQLADNAGVASRDVETEFVEAAIKTLAGQEDVAIQLIEQSPGQVFDRVVQEDLLAAYNLVVDQNVSYGTGANYTTLNAGTIRGLFPGTSWGSEHRKSTESPSGQVILQGLAANWSRLARKRYDTSGVHHFVHPSVAAYLSAAVDSKENWGRMLINATDFPNFNTSGLLDADLTPAEGMFAKTPLGPNIYHSVNIPNTVNEEATALETAEAYTYGATIKTDDCWFFESDLRARVLPEVVSGTLQIRYQVFAYVGLLVRYGPSLQFCGGKPFQASELKLGGYTF